MTALRTKLLEALTTQFNSECTNAVSRIRDGVAPYTRYIHAERERIETAQATLAGLRQKLSSLRARSETVVK
jgi:hypothetical protein